MKTHFFILAILLSFFSCVEAQDEQYEDQNDVLFTQQDLKDSPADRIQQWRIRHSDTTFWFESKFREKNRRWTLVGRSSRNIKHIQSHFQSGEKIDVRTISPRKFEITLDANQVIRAAMGEPILSDVQSSVGTRSIFTRFAPRIQSLRGDHRLYVLSSINAVYVGDSLMFRGRTNTAAGWELIQSNFNQHEARILSEPSLTPYEFDADLLPEILTHQSELIFTAYDGNQQFISKRVEFVLKLVSFASADKKADLIWPSLSCEPEVAQCLKKYKKSNFETCGYARQVEACWAPKAVDFSRRLKREIEGQYKQKGREIAAMGGRTKRAALARVSPNKVGLDDPFEDEDYLPSPNDGFSVYHAGVIYRRSSVLWQGFYSKKGRFEALKKVN